MSSLHSEKSSTSQPLNVSPEKSLILSCDTVVANERYVTLMLKICVAKPFLAFRF